VKNDFQVAELTRAMETARRVAAGLRRDERELSSLPGYIHGASAAQAAAIAAEGVARLIEQLQNSQSAQPRDLP